jgi:hypothetical protein
MVGAGLITLKHGQSIAHTWSTDRVVDSVRHLLLDRLGLARMANKYRFWVFGIYAVAILLSPRTNPVPLSREANQRSDAYIVYCYLVGKKPSWKESDAAWISKLPYPVPVMAAFRRLIDAMRSYRKTRGRGYKKLEAEAEGFVKALTSSSLIAETVLDDLIFQACPNIPNKDKETLSRLITQAKERATR